MSTLLKQIPGFDVPLGYTQQNPMTGEPPEDITINQLWYLFLYNLSQSVTNPVVPTNGLVRSVNNIAINTNAGNALQTDYFYICQGTITLTLPTCAGNSNLYSVKNAGTGIITVNFTGGQTADGSPSVTLPIPNMELNFISNGGGWDIN